MEEGYKEKKNLSGKYDGVYYENKIKLCFSIYFNYNHIL